VASRVAAGTPKRARSLAPTPLERIAGGLCLLLLLAVLAAVLRGAPDWGRLPFIIWAHLLTVTVALGVTPLLLLRRRGDRTHRRLGWVWSVSMFSSALLSFWVREREDGALSAIHILSLIVLLSVPLLVWNARHHRVEHHRRNAVGLTLGALLVAGALTFPFERLLGRWLFG